VDIFHLKWFSGLWVIFCLFRCGEGSFVGWTSVFANASGIVPPARAGHSAVGLNEQMIVFGGSDANITFGDLWQYNISKHSDFSQWNLFEQLLLLGSKSRQMVLFHLLDLTTVQLFHLRTCLFLEGHL
jgi:hypothetical protein